MTQFKELKIKKTVILFACSALLINIAIILLAFPREHSIWGETFFGIPYYFALSINPLITYLIVYLVSQFILNKNVPTSSHFKIGALISSLSFILYGIFHAATVAFLSSYEPLESALAIFGAIIMFGGLTLLPILIIFSTIVSYLIQNFILKKH